MPEEKPQEPLDLASFDQLLAAPAATPSPATSLEIVPANTQLVPASDTRLAAQPPAQRLVDISNLNPEDLATAKSSAAKIDFRRSDTLLSHGDNVLAQIAQSSRQLLAGVRLGDAGEVGRIAAAVIDGVKILRIQDLQSESAGQKTDKPRGLVGKILGTLSDAHTAFKGFAENRKKFLTLMDQEEAKARRTKSDLAVSHLQPRSAGRRRSRTSLSRTQESKSPPGQIALDRGEAGTRDAAPARDQLPATRPRPPR